jgi:hypothetical protein
MSTGAAHGDSINDAHSTRGCNGSPERHLDSWFIPMVYVNDAQEAT